MLPFIDLPSAFSQKFSCPLNKSVKLKKPIKSEVTLCCRDNLIANSADEQSSNDTNL